MHAPPIPPAARSGSRPAVRGRRGLAAGLAGATALVLAGVAAAPAIALEEPPRITETHTFAPDNGYLAGHAPAVSGDYAAYTEQSGNSVAISYLADPATNTWDTTTVTAPVPDEGFGAAIVLNADATTAYISAPWIGDVYAFTRSGTNDWALTQTFPAPAPVSPVERIDEFGTSLALNGNRLVVGAPWSAFEDRSQTGLAYVAELPSEPGATVEWTPLFQAGAESVQLLGSSVAVQGQAVDVGAPITMDSSGNVTGGVYLWDFASPDPGPRFATAPVALP